LALIPELAERVRQGRREERFQATADLPNCFREAAGPGWALIGDAGLQKDPFRASGISDSDAFRDAELLTEAIYASLEAGQPLDEALASYSIARGVAALPVYEDVCRTAAFTPPPPPLP
jgi:flavin-dependent dehydrogenase